MLTKEIIQCLKSIYGKNTKAKFTDALHANWHAGVSMPEFAPMIQGICSCLGVNFPEGYKMNSNTANAVASKLDLN